MPVLTMDFFPTFARLAGVSPPKNHQIDGIDIWPILNGGKGDPERVLHWQFGGQLAVRKGDWKLINDKLLVHLGKDPRESTNLFAEHPEVVQQLRQLNEAWTSDVGDR